MEQKTECVAFCKSKYCFTILNGAKHGFVCVIGSRLKANFLLWILVKEVLKPLISWVDIYKLGELTKTRKDDLRRNSE